VIHRRPLVLLLSLLALVGLAATATGAPRKAHMSPPKCKKGFKRVPRVVHRHGKPKVVYHCRRKATKPAISTPASTPAPAAKLASATTLSASYETLPPERHDPFTSDWEVGQLRISGSVSPFAVPSLACNGASGCVEPPGSLQSGPIVLPVVARSLNTNVNDKTAWRLLIPRAAGGPAPISLAEAAAGTSYFQATGSPDPSRYEPSTARAPIQVVQPHLPVEIIHNGLDSPVGTSFAPLSTIGTYTKVGGTDIGLQIAGADELSPTSSSDCVFQVRASGVAAAGDTGFQAGDPGEPADSLTIIKGLTPGTKQIEIWVRRESESGPCGVWFGNGYLIDELHS
jgi:hypothetical protein